MQRGCREDEASRSVRGRPVVTIERHAIRWRGERASCGGLRADHQRIRPERPQVRIEDRAHGSARRQEQGGLRGGRARNPYTSRSHTTRGLTIRRTGEDRARIKDWKAVNKIKGGYSQKRLGDLKATKPQIDYILGLETRLGYHTERDDHRNLTRFEASDKIATYKHRLGNK